MHYFHDDTFKIVTCTKFVYDKMSRDEVEMLCDLWVNLIKSDENYSLYLSPFLCNDNDDAHTRE